MKEEYESIDGIEEDDQPDYALNSSSVFLDEWTLNNPKENEDAPVEKMNLVQQQQHAQTELPRGDSDVTHEVTYPQLFETLARSENYSHYTVNAVAPPESVSSTRSGSPTRSSSSGGNRSGYQHRRDNHKCPFCLAQLNAYVDFRVSAPCCNTEYHYECLQRRRWRAAPLLGESVVRCPECAGPKADPSSLLDPESVKDAVQRGVIKFPQVSEEDAGRFWKIPVFQPALRRALMVAGSRQGLPGMMNGMLDGWRSRNEPINSEFIKKHNVSMDSLLRDGVSLPFIYHELGMTTWDNLKELGFQSKHLAILQNCTDLLVGYYHLDARRLREDLNIDIPSLRKLKLLPMVMAKYGFDTHEMWLMGLVKEQIAGFDWITMKDWIDTLRFGRIHIQVLSIKRSDFGSVLPGTTWDIITLGNALGMTTDGLCKYGLFNESDLRGDVPFRPKQKVPRRTGSPLSQVPSDSNFVEHAPRRKGGGEGFMRRDEVRGRHPRRNRRSISPPPPPRQGMPPPGSVGNRYEPSRRQEYREGRGAETTSHQGEMRQHTKEIRARYPQPSSTRQRGGVIVKSKQYSY